MHDKTSAAHTPGGCRATLRDGTQKQMNGGKGQDTPLANFIYD